MCRLLKLEQSCSMMELSRSWCQCVVVSGQAFVSSWQHPRYGMRCNWRWWLHYFIQGPCNTCVLLPKNVLVSNQPKLITNSSLKKEQNIYIYIYMFHTSAPASVPSHLFKQEPCVRHEVFEKVGSDSRFWIRPISTQSTYTSELCSWWAIWAQSKRG